MKSMQIVKKVKKQVKGITLIALVVTIIILLILAGVAINLTVGNNGIFNKAKQTVIAHENGEVHEGLNLKIADYEIGGVAEGSKINILNKLKSDGYVNEDNSVNIELLTGKSMQTGKGSIGVGDVYVIEVAGSNCNLIYYNKENESKNLGKLFTEAKAISEELPEEYWAYDPPTGGIAIKNISNYYKADPVQFDYSLGIDTIKIPSSYKGLPVTKIGVNMPYTNSYGNYEAMFGIHVNDVKNIIIPNSVTEICGGIRNDAKRSFWWMC